MGPLFITGMQRSGTTLLEKLLAGDPRVSLLSQPLPLLMVAIKGEFLADRGEEDPLPLGHLFREDRYGPTDLEGFLAAWRPHRERLRALFAEMEAYSGQYTRFARDQVESALGGLPPDADFAGTLAHFYRALAYSRSAEVVGGKETLCEEFLPYLLRRGWSAAIIVRDPRDVLASLNSGDGPIHAGSPKPTLLNLRNWRKSVAVALSLVGRSRFGWVRYEDLVTSPATSLSDLAADLGIGSLRSVAAGGEVRDQAGLPWSGNSSHGLRSGVSDASVGSWRRLLPAETARYVEAACLPELHRLGYATALDPTEAPPILRSFREPHEITRPGLAGYSESPANVAAEIERLERVTCDPCSASGSWFYSQETHRRLRETYPA